MTNYLDQDKNSNVKKFWEEKETEYKKFEKYFYGIIILYVILFALGFLNKLSINLLLIGTFLSFCFSIWFVGSEIKNLSNRISVLDEEIDKLHYDNSIWGDKK